MPLRLARRHRGDALTDCNDAAKCVMSPPLAPDHMKLLLHSPPKPKTKQKLLAFFRFSKGRKQEDTPKDKQKDILMEWW